MNFLKCPHQQFFTSILFIKQESEELFSQVTADIEDICGLKNGSSHGQVLVSSVKRKRNQSGQIGNNRQDEGSDLTQSWREALGPPPPMGKTKVSVILDISTIAYYLVIENLTIIWLLNPNICLCIYDLLVLTLHHVWICGIVSIHEAKDETKYRYPT